MAGLDSGLLLKMAEVFYTRAREEFEKALATGDTVGVRDAAEKAWNAVVHAVDALILKYGEALPTSHFERRRRLRELERRVKEIEKLGLLDRYMARHKVLHGETFYEGLIDVEQLKTEIEKVKKMIEDIKTLI
ncbi:MAG: PaREP1 family protein [Pyrobaculum sp.]